MKELLQPSDCRSLTLQNVNRIVPGVIWYQNVCRISSQRHGMQAVTELAAAGATQQQLQQPSVPAAVAEATKSEPLGSGPAQSSEPWDDAGAGLQGCIPLLNVVSPSADSMLMEQQGSQGLLSLKQVGQLLVHETCRSRSTGLTGNPAREG